MEANTITSSSPELTTTTVTSKEISGSGGAAAATPCRWNPTKEQINMLENLYKQGMRTPTAEQIQEITTRLQTYGHIEGKNVFYWFQNHKARQRQKQKQDHHMSAYYHHHQYLHHHHQLPAAVIFPIPRHPNVLYGQCYVPQSDQLAGFYTQYPKMIIPNATSSLSVKRRSPRTTVKTKLSAGAGNLNTPIKSNLVNGKNYTHQETLNLFPLHPTGILQQKEASANNANVYDVNACASGSSDYSQDQQLYFDFFSN